MNNIVFMPSINKYQVMSVNISLSFKSATNPIESPHFSGLNDAPKMVSGGRLTLRWDAQLGSVQDQRSLGTSRLHRACAVHPGAIFFAA